MGRAGMPYARSVQGRNGLPKTSLPPAGLVFDGILKRREVGFLITPALGYKIDTNFF
jgi:hypothetical protein